MRKKEQEHLIQTVYPGSIAEELEIEPGDVLLRNKATPLNNDNTIENISIIFSFVVSLFYAYLTFF